MGYISKKVAAYGQFVLLFNAMAMFRICRFLIFNRGKINYLFLQYTICKRPATIMNFLELGNSSFRGQKGMPIFYLLFMKNSISRNIKLD